VFLKELRRSPDSRITNADRGDTFSFQLVANREEFVKGKTVVDGNSMLLQEFLIVPEDIAMMNAGQNGVRFSILRQHTYKRLRESPFPAIALVEFGDRFAVSLVYILAEQFPSGMALPRVRRVIDGKARLQYGPRPRTASARNRGINASCCLVIELRGLLLFINTAIPSSRNTFSHEGDCRLPNPAAAHC
jgi:hypothetical protein